MKNILKPKCKFCDNDGIIFADLDNFGKSPVCWNCYKKENERRKKGLMKAMLNVEVHS